MQTKSGYQGDNLLALIGACIKCDTKAKIYYVQCRDDRKFRILHFSRTGKTSWRGTCHHCFVTQNLKESVVWHTLQNRVTTDEELAIINLDTGLNKQAFDDSVREQTRTDAIADNFVLENKEKLARLKR